MALTLIGLGLFDEKDITLHAIEECKNSDNVYLELYTGKWYGNVGNLENIIGKEIIQIRRKDLEENSDKILKEAKIKKIAILTEGDPLIATTHSTIIHDARNFGIETKVIHNASIISAIGETGLHAYKFGPTVTIPFPEKTKGVLPKSIFDIIKENRKRGLHTLCLLDIVGEENRYMEISQALDILLSGKVLSKKDMVVAFTKAGSTDSRIIFANVSDLIEMSEKSTPAILIIPGKLHFTEREFLDSYA